MSDFIFSSSPTPRGYLTRRLNSIYHKDAPEVKEFHGSWGCLGVSTNLYQGFAPLETDEHICIVIGGPLLTFTDNEFLTDQDDTAGTQKLYKKWLSENGVQWGKDISGPFVFLILNKQTKDLRVITDLMSFIPLYEGKCQNTRWIGTHIDIIAKMKGFEVQHDPVSIADFVLHGVVTYPYTFYKKARQLAPAAIHHWQLDIGGDPVSKHYWQPVEDNPWQTIDQAAESLRDGIREYIQSITLSMDHIATFLSGGEDSRAILALLPDEIQRDAYIFLNEENKESRIARKVAKVHKARFFPAQRHLTRYLDVLPACSDLVGTGSQYINAHTYGFHKSCNLYKYPAVFGGFLSDTFLKGYHIYKLFLHNRRQPAQTGLHPDKNPSFTDPILSELHERRRSHLSMVEELRPHSASEWFSLWPISMHSDVPNIHGNRRLFRSYEPFTAHTVVKVASAVPQEWKIKRRLFHRMAYPLFEPTKHIPHAKGWMPYHPGWKKYSPWYDTLLTRPIIKAWHKRKKPKNRYEGTWCDWGRVMQTDAWDNLIETYTSINYMPGSIFTTNIKNLFDKSTPRLNTLQKVNLLQCLYFLKKPI